MTVLGLLDSAVTLEGPAEVVAAVAALFPPSQPAPGARARAVRVREDGAVLVDGSERADLGRSPLPAAQVQAVLTAVNAVVLEDVRSFAVHAGVVARDGAVVAWADVSGAGKTTLVAACLRAGLEYVSDESLVLEDGRVRPYPRPLGLSAWSLGAVGLPGPASGTAERPVHVRELGADVAAGPLRVAHLVVLDRRPGPAALEPCSRAASALRLLQHSFNHHRSPDRAFHAAADAAEGASCWVLHHDRPEEGASLVRSLLG